MLLIRQEQKHILAAASFNAWLADHARRFFAEKCHELGPAGTRLFIAEMVACARLHGLVDGPDICRYLDLAFTFGSGFDRALPWAQAILGAADGRASVITMDRLYAAAMAELDPASARAAGAADHADDEDSDDQAAEAGAGVGGGGGGGAPIDPAGVDEFGQGRPT